MKKTIILSSFMLCAFAGNISAQCFDNDPTINIENKDQEVKFTVGARFMSDVAYYHTDFTPLKSGAAISDARIRTSMTYKDLFFYADFDFSGGKFSQKNIFLRYTLKDDPTGNHSIKAGYYNNVATMANNTSRGSLHFMSRSAAVNALAPARELGITYKFYNDQFLLNQGISAENPYNNQKDGYQGFIAGLRWLYKPINNDEQTLHLGVTGRYERVNTSTVKNNVATTEIHPSSSVQTYVDKFAFTEAKVPYARDVFDLGAEVLYKNPKFFARGEYLMKRVTKKRDDNTLFVNQLGGMWSWTTLESWQKSNPIGNTNFNGGYVELGYQIFGDGYKYDNAEGLLKGWNGRSLELVARYSYLGMNDLVKGELYSAGRDQYYPKGVLADYPATSLSIGGGNMHSVTLGANYSFNKYVQTLLEYTYNRLERDKYSYDKNIHTLQARLLFSF